MSSSWYFLVIHLCKLDYIIVVVIVVVFKANYYVVKLKYVGVILKVKIEHCMVVIRWNCPTYRSSDCKNHLLHCKRNKSNLKHSTYIQYIFTTEIFTNMLSKVVVTVVKTIPSKYLMIVLLDYKEFGLSRILVWARVVLWNASPLFHTSGQVVRAFLGSQSGLKIRFFPLAKSYFETCT